MADPNQPLVTGHVSWEAVSSVQKCIRRGLSQDAYYWAYSLWKSGHGAWLIKRLKIILEEDVGVADVVSYTAAHMALSRFIETSMDDPKAGLAELSLGNVILSMCKANPKTRDADCLYWMVKHDMLTNPPHEIPDFALDGHTRRGRQMGRSDSNFYPIAYKLEPTDVTNTDWRKAQEVAEHWVTAAEKTGRYGNTNPIDALPNGQAASNASAKDAEAIKTAALNRFF